MFQFDKTVVGKIVAGTYKRADRPSNEQAIEVNSLHVMPDTRGFRHFYLVGTVMMGFNKGDVLALRGECFRAETVKVLEAPKFKAVEGYAEKEWYFTPNSASFAPLERVVKAEDRVWAAAVGGLLINDYEVKPEPKA